MNAASDLGRARAVCKEELSSILHVYQIYEAFMEVKKRICGSGQEGFEVYQNILEVELFLKNYTVFI